MSGIHSFKTIISKDYEFLGLDVSLLLHILLKIFPLMLGGTVLCFLLGWGIIHVGFQDHYRSEAKAIVTVPGNTDQKNSGGPEITARDRAALVQSTSITKILYTRLRKMGAVSALKNPSALWHRHLLNIHTVPKSHVVAFSGVNTNPQKAQKMDQALVKTYQDTSKNFALEPLLSQKKVLLHQITQTEKQLSQLNHGLYHLARVYHTVDIHKEGQLLLTQRSELTQDFRNTAAALAGKKAEIVSLKKTLRSQSLPMHYLLVDKTDKSAANGIESLIFSPPDAKQAKKSQIGSDSKESHTHQSIVPVAEKNPAISKISWQNIQQDLLKHLYLMEAEKASLETQLKTRKQQLRYVEAQLHKIPQAESAFSHIIHQKWYQESFLHQLESSVAGIQTKLLNNTPKIQMIQEPSFPRAPLMPDKRSLLIWAAMVSFALPWGIGAGKEYAKLRVTRIRFLEKHFKMPVLSLFPFMPRDPRCLRAFSPALSVYHEPMRQAYHRLAINIAGFAHSQNKKAFAVAPITTDGLEHSTVLVETAKIWAKQGQRVLIVDGHFTDPRVDFLLGGCPQSSGGIEILLGQLENLNPDTSVSERLALMQPYIHQSSQHENIFYCSASTNVVKNGVDPTSLLNSYGFKIFMETLKSEYNWVLMDTPALLGKVAPYLILRHLDGVVLWIDPGSTKRQIELVNHNLQLVGTEVLGVALPDIMSDLRANHVAQIFPKKPTRGANQMTDFMNC